MSRDELKIGWVGFHVEGLPAFEAVLKAGYSIRTLVTLKPSAMEKRSAATDYMPLCRQYGVPVLEVGNINEDAAVAHLRNLDLDLCLVIGWSQILHKPALQTARLGMIGAHASMLPHYRGSAPINWAVIRGKKETGNSLIWLADGVDEGEIIDQMPLQITPYDTCATLYGKVALTNRDMILRALESLSRGDRPGRPQTHVDEPILPRRRPDDGRIDWKKPAREVYDFIRALTHPYPGAFTELNGSRWNLWNCSLLPGTPAVGAKPGQIIGPVFSPSAQACGQLVACSDGSAIVLLELSDERGTPVCGPALAELPWKDLRFGGSND